MGECGQEHGIFRWTEATGMTKMRKYAGQWVLSMRPQGFYLTAYAAFIAEVRSTHTCTSMSNAKDIRTHKLAKYLTSAKGENASHLHTLNRLTSWQPLNGHGLCLEFATGICSGLGPRICIDLRQRHILLWLTPDQMLRLWLQGQGRNRLRPQFKRSIWLRVSSEYAAPLPITYNSY